jgi:hypothetical protein
MWLWNLVGWPVWVLAIGLALTSVAVYANLAKTDERRAVVEDADRVAGLSGSRLINE